jgi:hypothetical protein
MKNELFYQIRSQAWNEYSKLVWNRYNWFLVLETAHWGYFFDSQSRGEPFLIQISVVGMTISFLWLALGLQDWVSLGKHRDAVKALECALFHVERMQRPLEFRQSWILAIFPAISLFSWLYYLLL